MEAVVIGQARFTYTDQDMIATQRAGWTWYAHWRNILVTCAVIAAIYVALFALLNAVYQTQGSASDVGSIAIASVATTLLLAGLLFVIAYGQGRQMLHRDRQPGGRQTWDGDKLTGEYTLTWDSNELHLHNDVGHADLAWAAIGAWLDTPEVLLLFPSGGRAFSLPNSVVAAGWKAAPKVFIYPFGSHAIALPKRALIRGEAERLIDTLRAAGIRERRRFGLIAAKGASTC